MPQRGTAAGHGSWMGGSSGDQSHLVRTRDSLTREGEGRTIVIHLFRYFAWFILTIEEGGDHSFSAGINNAHVFMGLYIFCRMPQSKTKYNQTFKQRNKIFSSVSARALNTAPGPECCCCHFSCGVFSCWNLTFETVSKLSKDADNMSKRILKACFSSSFYQSRKLKVWSVGRGSDWIPSFQSTKNSEPKWSPSKVSLHFLF